MASPTRLRWPLRPTYCLQDELLVLLEPFPGLHGLCGGLPSCTAVGEPSVAVSGDPRAPWHRQSLPRHADLAMPHLLLVQVGLASGLGQYTEVVREAQKGLKLRNVRLVDTMGLPLQDGHLHLNTQAQVQLGHKLAQSYLNYGKQL